MTTIDLDEFIPWEHPSPMLDAIGGFLQHREDPLRTGFVVDQPKLNGRGLLHGGVIGAIGDAVIGHSLAVLSDPPTRLVTVNLSYDILGSAVAGDWVDVVATPTRLGRRLAAGSATFSTSRVIATVTGLFVPASAPRSD